LKGGSFDSFEVTWDTCPAAEWDRHLATAGLSSLEQSWAYGEALAALEACRVRRALVSRAGTALAMVQAFDKRRFLPLAAVRILRGPLWLEPELSPELRQGVLLLIKRQFRLARRELLIWSPELVDGPGSLQLMRACGARQMVTGYSTVVLDLQRPEDDLRAGLHGKWRNMLVGAERAGLGVEAASDGRTLDWLVDRAEAFRRRAGFVGLPGDLVRAIARAQPDRQDVLVLTAEARRERLAGVLFFVHGRTATYTLAWTGPEGRRLRAHNLLLWRAVLALRERGVDWLDLGGVNAAAAPGVARFKLGLGGRLHTLAGTFI
jgi:hypothetical protein